MSIEIRLIQKGEESLVNDIYNKAGNKPRPMENFSWEFKNAPAGAAIYVVAVDTAKEGNQIIGTQCAIPIEWIDNKGQKILTAKSEDTYVDPSYRGQKLFDRMYDLLFEECRKAGIDVIWGFTYARKPFLKVGFEIPADTLQGILVNDINKATAYLAGLNKENKAKQKIQIAILSLASKFISTVRNSGSSSLPKDISVETKLLTDKSTFIANGISADNTIVYDLFQSSEYSEWRIAKNPFKNNYKEFNYFRDAKQVATILANIRPEGFAYIEQMYFAAGLSDKERKALIRNAIVGILKNEVFLIRFWGFDKQVVNIRELELLKSAGFVFIKKGTAIVWKNMQPKDAVNFIKPEQTHFTHLFTQGNI